MRKRLFLIAFANASNVTLRFSPIRPKTLRDIISDISSEKHPAPNHCPEQLEIGTEQFRIAQRIKQGQKLCNVRVSERAVHTWDIPEVFGRITEPERLVLKAVLRLRRRDRIRQSGDADPVLRSSIEKAVGCPVGVRESRIGNRIVLDRFPHALKFGLKLRNRVLFRGGDR